MLPLGPNLGFNHREWADGMTLNMPGGGRIKININRVVRNANRIQPSIRWIAQQDELAGRSLADHRHRVEMMAQRYTRGADPSTGCLLPPDERQAAINAGQNYSPPEWKGARRDTPNESEALDFLMEAFKAAAPTLNSEDAD